MNALYASFTGLLFILLNTFYYCYAEQPSMFLCLDSMIHLKAIEGNDPQKLVYGYIDGKKTPCMSEYEFRLKYSHHSFNRTQKIKQKSSPEIVKRESVYKGDKKLTGADLRGLDLQGLDLSGADLRNAQLESTDLRGAKLYKADLTGANLQNAYCKNIDLREADLTDAQAKGAYFHNADFRNTKGLTIELLQTVATLYKAQMDEALQEIIETRYSSKLRDPKNSWTQRIYSSDDKLPQSELADPERFR